MPGIDNDSEIIEGVIEEGCYLNLVESLFVAFISEGQNSCGLLFSNDSINKDEIGDFLNKSKTILKTNTSEWKIKLIGKSELIKKFLSLVELNENLTIVDRNTPCEILFFPHRGEILLSKENSTVIPLNKAINNKKIKVLIVDDSKTIRSMLKNMLSQDSEIEVCSMAENPLQVEDLILKYQPDVITLDIHMPEMTGVELLKNIIMPKYKTPTIMVSSLSLDEGPLVFEAMDSGAVDYIQKPDFKELNQVGSLLIEKIKVASKVQVRDKVDRLYTPFEKSETSIIRNIEETIVFIGSSTGGTTALTDMLTKLPAEIPPIIIVQHIPPIFSEAFAIRLNSLCKFSVKEVKDGDWVEPNTVYIAPGGYQMRIKNISNKYRLNLFDEEPVNRFKPSVDVLFFSAAKNVKVKMIGLILTGMGKDGAKGIESLKNHGATTMAQSESSCVVYGMPKAAIELGCVDYIVPLNKFPMKLIQVLNDEPMGKVKGA